MRFATISTRTGPACAVQLANGQFLPVAAAGVQHAALLDGSLQAVIEGGDAALAELAQLVARADDGDPSLAALAVSDPELLAPLPRPAKNVFCVGRNYAEHIAEGARAQNTTIAVTEVPVFFTKPCTAVIGPEAEIPIFPQVSTQIDYEVELAVIIGTPGRNIAKERAYDHVWGYTILNDITARDVQRRHGGQYFKGKGLDGSCPLGPVVVTRDELPEPQNIGLRCLVNGEVRQSSTTAKMIFDIPTLIASLSEGLTLEAGDIIATGTPSGVGYAMDPPRFLQDGDKVVCEIDGIGRLANTLRTV
ncbi:2-keto-4-pentenoate hydratase/2-oxohepta-3-ene-1,7-dioic acid hydratase in catechol pathway [Roseinatronobacter thiooxidans]|uniref:2-keto-4-pentenoate hydratase/2-oxohepta-3-ene-1,7-dioic acid hydratase in catechol pathway n=1 Tax=Roseinatronobacter thiooxidans TaxID=121821 RepID=A0A2W7Q3S7_9RHOB|nr:fumarylacetoacetate hydrolase family protein [Roseinatronobacter thiooxidans]PZX40700.1 2-keto-4-pentenoate hydratase/2-oxohepta-3-ene-1,7-dioic acid hydratase in catechol pathway [Roseinatronobacter thiooxidans]